MRSPLVIWFARSPLCEGLSDDEVAQVFDLFQIEEHPAGHALYSVGDPADALYVVLEGRVVVSRGGSVVGEVTPGASVGEASLFARSQARSATADCATNVSVLRVGKERFREALVARDIPAMLVFNLGEQLATRLTR